MKQSRQLVFVTHNPNIPVLADAERVPQSEYSNAGNTSGNEREVQMVKDGPSQETPTTG